MIKRILEDRLHLFGFKYCGEHVEHLCYAFGDVAHILGYRDFLALLNGTIELLRIQQLGALGVERLFPATNQDLSELLGNPFPVAAQILLDLDKFALEVLHLGRLFHTERYL